MTINCPTCNRPLPPVGISVDTTLSVVTLDDGEKIRLRPKGALILAHLIRRIGRTVTHDAISQVVWDEGGASNNAMAVHITTLRKVLEPRGWAIQNVWGTGYRLIKIAQLEGEAALSLRRA